MALDKNKLKAQMQAKSPTLAPQKIDIALTDLTKINVAQPNDRTVERPNGLDNLVHSTPLKAIKRQKRAKDGVKNTSRYSFEITAELKDQLERSLLEHQLSTGKKVSTSAVIRTAIEKYLKVGRL
jgi:hypothetical protein